MKVIICGAGQVGWQIARHLSRENNDVTVVDNNPALVRRATDTLDVQGLTGFASHPYVLDTAGAGDADMIIAATFSDEVNMVTCQVAHSVFSVPRKIARLRSQSYLDAIYSDLYRRDHLPIDVVISPEKEVAEAAASGRVYFLAPRPSTLRASCREMRRCWASRSHRRVARGAEHPAQAVAPSLLLDVFAPPSSWACGARARCLCRNRATSCSRTTRSTCLPTRWMCSARWRSSARRPRRPSVSLSSVAEMLA